MFDDKDGSGSWFCRKCGAGYGFSLAARFLGHSADEWQKTCASIGEALGTRKREIPEIKKGATDLDKYNRLVRMWDECTGAGHTGIVANYLASRGLPLNDRLGYHPRCYWSDAGRTGTAPAMIARVMSYDDRLVSLHRTYLDPAGGKARMQSPKKLMPSLPGLMGGAIRLADISDDGVLGIAEGIETALSASMLHGDVPVWSCVSAAGIEAFVPPEGCRLLNIYADNDASAVGQIAAFKLKARLFGRISCEVILPRLNDWNDDLMKRIKE